MQNRATQDVRGQTRPGHVQDHESAKIEELERKLRDFEEAEYQRRRQEERYQAVRKAEEVRRLNDRVGQVR